MESFTGNGTSGAFLWGAQLNIGSTAKPYFPTTDRLDVPRIDYTGGGCGKLLLEPQRTNLVTYSEDFSNAAWVKSNSTITANSTTSPDGTTNADKLIPSISNVNHICYQDSSMTSGVTYTQSIYAKSDAYSFIQITGSAGVPATYQNFNLIDGTLGTTDGGIATITNYGNGWYRCTYTLTATTTTAGGRFVIAIVPLSTSGRLAAFAGNGTSGAFIYGAQLEAGSYSTSYIKSEGAATTRLADSCSKTGISSLIGQTEGTLFVEYSALSNDLTYRSIGLNSGAATNRLLITFNNVSNNINFLVQVGGVTQVSINYSGATITSNLKVAFAYKENDFVAYVNGTQAGTDTSGSTYSSGTLTTFSFDNSVGADKLVAKLNQALLFTTRLTNTELATLTTL